jgi:hypothetical protein
MGAPWEIQRDTMVDKGRSGGNTERSMEDKREIRRKCREILGKYRRNWRKYRGIGERHRGIQRDGRDSGDILQWRSVVPKKFQLAFQN